MWVSFLNGRVVYVCFVFSPLQWLVLVFLLSVGNFELDLTSYLLHKFIAVVSTIILLYHMYGRFVFSPL